ncbi:uncharacterized protein [Physcomitrium patens]
MRKGTCGDAYRGNFAHGLREGLGEMTYNDGINSLNYMGEWMQDQKHGHGRFLYLHSTYEGEWRHGKHDGIGIQTQIVDKTKSNCLQMPVYSATVYEGSWIRGFPHGSGKQLWIWDQNKEILGVLHNAYIGGFENGMRSNRGTFYYANGAIYQGYWKNNLKNGHGLYTYEDGRLNKVICNLDHFDINNNKDTMILIRHALDNVTNNTDDMDRLKLKLLYITLRFANAFRTTFHNYSALSMQASENIPQEKQEQVDSTPTFTKVNQNSSRKSSLSKRDGEKLLSPQLLLPENKNLEQQYSNEGGIPCEIDQSLLLLNAIFKNHGLPNSTITKGSENNFSKEYLEHIAKYVQNEGSDVTSISSGFGDVNDNLCNIYKNMRLEGQSYAMTVESFWHLCYSAHIMEPGLGLAQIDVIIYPPSNAWDDAFDLYCPKRKLIHQEVVENLIKIGLTKCFGCGIQLEKKLHEFFESCFNKIGNNNEDSLYKFSVDQPTQAVLLQYKQHFKVLFGKFILKSKTNGFFIKIKHIFNFFLNVVYNFEDQKHLDGSAPKESNPIPQKRPPSKTVEQKVHQDENVADNKTTGSYQILLKTISETLYQIKYQDGDPTLYLELEINFKEFELILLQLANLKLGPYKYYANESPVKTNAELIQSFMNEISQLSLKAKVSFEDKELSSKK